ncbi:hypothetical protein OPQ81_004789 [Rhizoctonia solani]|nr:hypothetical protein OPQ81_004789 [Rhizoctonia solani]
MPLSARPLISPPSRSRSVPATHVISDDHRNRRVPPNQHPDVRQRASIDNRQVNYQYTLPSTAQRAVSSNNPSGVPYMSAITLTEFTHLLSACRPPSGWGKSITVALSGGPDSICLLSLLQQVRLDVPLGSITIDHSLQPTSRDSALRTLARSEAIGVPGIILPADWDRGKPKAGEAVEEAARDARYRALWRGLRGQGSETVMFGHHADDQLETVIMRVLRGTGTYGLGGMRAVRRWGWVGEPGRDVTRLHPTCTSGLGAVHALRGMRTYIARPLLTIPKLNFLHGFELKLGGFVGTNTGDVPCA